MDINHAIIQETFDTLSDISYKEKKRSLSENEKNNLLLDKILEVKEKINKKVSTLDVLVEKIERITWYDNFTDDDLKKISAIIDLSTILRNLWKIEYAKINKSLNQHNIAKKEIKDFKNALDDFEETYLDLGQVVFSLPNDIEFSDLTKKIL